MSRTLTRRSFVGGAVVALAIPAPAASAAPTEHRVEIRRFKFAPATLQVKKGDRITWINHDIAPHTATAQSEAWDTGRINKDSESTLVVDAEGRHAYFCRYHPAMKGELIVT